MKNNEIPLLFGKVTDKALFNAHDFLNSLKQKYRRIDIAVLCFSEAIADEIHKHYKITVGKVTFKDPKLNSVKIGKKSIFFAKSNIGAPAATTVLEEIIALGAKKIIFIGSTGSLQDTEVGEIIFPTKAIRDEGTSLHYANPSKYAYSSKKLTKELESVCINKEILYTKGTTWTIDAPYRETIRKFDKYKKEGVLTVEMEASALFTLCKVRQVECAGVFWVSDQLKRKGWAPSFYTPAYYDGAKKAFRILKGFLEKENKA